MFKALTPIAAILIAIGLFVTFVKPSFTEIKSMEREADEYANALQQADELQRRIDDKLTQRRNFDQTGLVRLSQILPTEVNTVDLILSLSEVAKTHNMLFSGIAVQQSTPKAGGGTTAASEEEFVDDPTLEETDPELVDDLALEEGSSVSVDDLSYVDLSFTVEGTYEDFKEYLADLERSLTLFEVMKLSFGESEGDTTPYLITIRTYSHTAAD